jgi:hypothetical protein
MPTTAALTPSHRVNLQHLAEIVEVQSLFARESLQISAASECDPKRAFGANTVQRSAHPGSTNAELHGKKFLSKANLFVEIFTKDARFDAFVGKRGQVLASFDSWNALRRGFAYPNPT